MDYSKLWKTSAMVALGADVKHLACVIQSNTYVNLQAEVPRQPVQFPDPHISLNTLVVKMWDF